MRLNHYNRNEVINLHFRKAKVQNRQRWLNKPVASAGFHGWLIERGSLTLRLKNQFDDFSVKPQHQLREKCFIEDAAALSMPLRIQVLIREVTLNSHEHALVYAHSVMPFKSLTGAWRGLGLLGNRSLGSVLFANPLVTRTPITFKKLAPHHPLYQQAAKYHQHPPKYLWARRSVFMLKNTHLPLCAKILVTEVFLPSLIN